MTRMTAAAVLKHAAQHGLPPPAGLQRRKTTVTKALYDNHTDAEIQDAKPLKRPRKLVEGNQAQARSAGRVALRFTLRRVQLLDPCAKYGSCKALIDGLRYAGIIQNDREEDITLEVNQEKVSHYNEEETEIVIEIPYVV